MKYRRFGRIGWDVAEIGFGAWAVGGEWGAVDDEQSIAAMKRALELGVNFFDTADVYGDGRSERLLGRLRKETKTPFHIATKAGRRLRPHVAAGYDKENLTAFVDRSLKNIGVDSLELLQLHCPPTDTYYRPETFAAMDDLVKAGKVRHYGVSVERVEEGLKAMEFPNVASIQIIFNMFRQRPAERFLAEAQRRGVATIIRVPLASGMLTGKLTAASKFPADDHRHYNRHGEAFDVGETFSGVPYEIALQAVEELKLLVPGGATLAQLALRWILMFDGVSTIIPGGKNSRQVEDNCGASALPALTDQQMKSVRAIYDRHIRGSVHQRW
ncbi:MAG TPA: aldo/keto reductase [Steroidobacteraceae bacterium]|nr:aldo/keto reductase [Steroidobacteraceae bacterium]